MKPHTTALSVNLNKVALLRNSRHLDIPGVRRSAEVSLAAGAQGITVHPRPDERHIRPADVYAIAEVVAAYRSRAKPGRAQSGPEFNIEGNPFDTSGQFLKLVRAVRPDQCTLVPDSPDQATSDHGWDIAADGERLRPLLAELRESGIRSSVFMDADNLTGIAALAKLGADRIELYTEPYAAAHASGDAQRLEITTQRFAVAARIAGGAGLGVNAGHDLNLENLAFFLEHVSNVLEVSIGHALIGEAIFRGLERTVRDYLAVITGDRAARDAKAGEPSP